jgi:hypothetical protein
MTLQCINPDDLPIPEMYTPENVVVGVAMISPGYLMASGAIAVIDHTIASHT